MSVVLPCGSVGLQDADGDGVICQNCLCVFGSLSCPCDKFGNPKKTIVTPHPAALARKEGE